MPIMFNSLLTQNALIRGNPFRQAEPPLSVAQIRIA
jgi:hypothetical protein